MRYIEIRADESANTPAPVLLVLLQAAYTTPEDFLQQGFVTALQQRGIAADVVLADNVSAHVSDGSIVARLRALIAPLMQRGYRELWLAGVSLGGFSALAYASHYGDEVAGLCLIAPYPGTQDVLRPIREADSLADWAKRPRRADEDDEHTIWRWLADWQTRQTRPAIWLGTGDADRFIAGQAMIAALLPPAQVHYVPGGHAWPQWQALWQTFLAQGALD